METKFQKRKEHTGGRSAWASSPPGPAASGEDAEEPGQLTGLRQCWEIRCFQWDPDRQLLRNNGEAEVGIPPRD